MRFSSPSPIRKASAGAVVAAVIMLSATPALANAPGAGVFFGHEYPPATEFTNMATLCARFDPALPFPDDPDEEPSGPLVHELDMTGTFHGLLGTGTATFTRSEAYYANPEGTHSDEDCLSPAWVDGEMTITFVSGLTTFDCAGDGRYMRRATSVYTLEFRGECTPGGTTYVLFEGGQEPCPPITGCPTDPEAGSVMEGAYEQTDTYPPPLPPPPS